MTVFAKFRHIFGPPKFRLSQFMYWTVSSLIGLWGLQPKKSKTTANFKLGTVFFFCFFRFFHLWPILTGLTGSAILVLVGNDSLYETFTGFHRH